MSKFRFWTLEQAEGVLLVVARDVGENGFEGTSRMLTHEQFEALSESELAGIVKVLEQDYLPDIDDEAQAEIESAVTSKIDEIAAVSVARAEQVAVDNAVLAEALASRPPQGELSEDLSGTTPSV
jgi:hypothetical protein